MGDELEAELQLEVTDDVSQLERCAHALRALAPWLTDVTKRLAQVSSGQGEDLRLATQEMDGSSSGSWDVPISVVHGAAEVLNGIMDVMLGPFLRRRLCGPPSAPVSGKPLVSVPRWLQILRFLAGPSRGEILSEKDRVWDLSALGLIWQSPWWLDGVTMPALRQARRDEVCPCVLFLIEVLHLLF